MTQKKYLAMTLLAATLMLPEAKAHHDGGAVLGIGWGPGNGPGRGPQPGRDWPQPNFPPQGFGLCQGDFSGSFEDGRSFFLSVSGEGDVKVSAQLDSSPEALMGQGTCVEQDGQATLSISLENGNIETGQIFLASDNQIYMEGTQDDGKKFSLLKQN
jgi:hypothetical protein